MKLLLYHIVTINLPRLKGCVTIMVLMEGFLNCYTLPFVQMN